MIQIYLFYISGKVSKRQLEDLEYLSKLGWQQSRLLGMWEDILIKNSSHYISEQSVFSCFIICYHIFAIIAEHTWLFQRYIIENVQH